MSQRGSCTWNRKVFSSCLAVCAFSSPHEDPAQQPVEPGGDQPRRLVLGEPRQFLARAVEDVDRGDVAARQPGQRHPQGPLPGRSRGGPFAVFLPDQVLQLRGGLALALVEELEADVDLGAAPRRPVLDDGQPFGRSSAHVVEPQRGVQQRQPDRRALAGQPRRGAGNGNGFDRVPETVDAVHPTESRRWGALIRENAGTRRNSVRGQVRQ